jgi:hypothetical protein
MEILKEVTQWDVEYRQPNHTYLVNKKGQIIAYAKWHSKEIMIFKSRTKLDKRYRKFEKTNHKELSKLIPQFKSEDKSESVDIIKPSASVRVFNVLSKGKNYTVTFNTISKTVSCGCTGYGYRRTCSHSKAVAQKVL